MNSPFSNFLEKRRDPSNLSRPWKSQRAMIYGLPPWLVADSYQRKCPCLFVGNTTNRTLLWLGCNCKESKQKHVPHVSDFYNKNNVLKHGKVKVGTGAAAKFIVCVSHAAFNFSIFIYKTERTKEKESFVYKTWANTCDGWMPEAAWLCKITTAKLANEQTTTSVYFIDSQNVTFDSYAKIHLILRLCEQILTNVQID